VAEALPQQGGHRVFIVHAEGNGGRGAAGQARREMTGARSLRPAEATVTSVSSLRTSTAYQAEGTVLRGRASAPPVGSPRPRPCPSPGLHGRASV
jgi:hypothetical protein